MELQVGTRVLDECRLTHRGTGGEDERLGDMVGLLGDLECSRVSNVGSADVEVCEELAMVEGVIMLYFTPIFRHF